MNVPDPGIKIHKCNPTGRQVEQLSAWFQCIIVKRVVFPGITALLRCVPIFWHYFHPGNVFVFSETSIYDPGFFFPVYFMVRVYSDQNSPSKTYENRKVERRVDSELQTQKKQNRDTLRYALRYASDTSASSRVEFLGESPAFRPSLEVSSGAAGKKCCSFRTNP